MKIVSPHNPRIKLALRLRERRHRERAGLTLVEGHDELRLALDSGVRPQMVFYCPSYVGFEEAAPLLDGARRAGAELVEVGAAAFAKLAYRQNPDGWLAVVPIRRPNLASLSLGACPLLVLVEAVEKPGNLGAILRTADAAGVDALIVCDPTTDISNPNVVRASKGTLYSVALAQSEGPAALGWLRERAIPLVATSPHAELPYTAADLRGPVALAVGSETAGLSAPMLAQAEVTVRIPMRGRVNSLNVATSAALMLYEVWRQRGQAQGATHEPD